LEVMSEHHIRRLPIVDGEGQLVGIITVDDLTRSLDSEVVRPLLDRLSVAESLKATTSAL
jgi:CBS domain-containing protein